MQLHFQQTSCWGLSGKMTTYWIEVNFEFQNRSKILINSPKKCCVMRKGNFKMSLTVQTPVLIIRLCQNIQHSVLFMNSFPMNVTLYFTIMISVVPAAQWDTACYRRKKTLIWKPHVRWWRRLWLCVLKTVAYSQVYNLLCQTFFVVLAQTGPGRSSSLVDPHSFTGAMVEYRQFTYALSSLVLLVQSAELETLHRF